MGIALRSRLNKPRLHKNSFFIAEIEINVKQLSGKLDKKLIIIRRSTTARRSAVSCIVSILCNHYE